ncbi:hypothetical protein DFQ28_002162 [Apophysomyces sp. BC1034]|nr:hypothetical protein DFQ30_007599 [Apophysomyces sp. BC1015]KAG0179791.1 hypothetical protein DFQ29_001638 [Apophysomyces sp. BC1021]KAG0190383.1 hypothetical protein DFQ28_002162 [Apophysomyces sp. BC1034]
MSLVPNYGSSDSEDSDIETTATAQPKSVKTSFASLLPPPKKTTSSKPVIYVDLPSKHLNDDDDDSEKRAKRPKLSSPFSNLADLLPAPKNSGPTFLRQQTDPSPSVERSKLKSVEVKKPEPVSIAPEDVPEEEEEEEEDKSQQEQLEIKHSGPFFRLGAELNVTPTVNIPKPVVHKSQQQTKPAKKQEEKAPAGVQQPATSEEATEETTTDAYTYYNYDPNAMYAYDSQSAHYYWQQQQAETYQQDNNQAQQGAVDLDHDALHQLGGKRRGQSSNVKIRDVNQADMLPSAEERERFQSIKTPMFDDTGKAVVASDAQKRRNNIMSLIAQAQDMNQKLEEQYAAQRKVRREAKAKYGF